MKNINWIRSFLLYLSAVICSMTSYAQDSLRSSNLPLVLISSPIIPIPDEPKINAHIAIIDHPTKRNFVKDTPTFESDMLIETRGSSSQSFFPQKSFSLKFIDSTGEDYNASVMDMPEEHDWILYAPYNDKTCQRNVLSYLVSNEIGMYASKTKYCELYINGDYQGIYVWMEKIKRDKNRVDIAKLDSADLSSEDLTGGYIFKIDKTTSAGGEGCLSNYPASTGTHLVYQYEYPQFEDLQDEQKKYLCSYIDSFEKSLVSPLYRDTAKGYRRFVDVNSFFNYFILNEISRNVDGYRLSTFLYKDRNAKIHIGPPWDYNLAWWNADYCQGSWDNGWSYQFNSYCPTDPFPVPFWWDRFLSDTGFTNALKCRYSELRRNVLQEKQLFYWIDSIAHITDEARARHFAKYPILGKYVCPNPSPLPQTFEQEIAALKVFIVLRLRWLDDNMPGTCRISNSIEGSKDEYQLFIHPQPVKDICFLNTPEGHLDEMRVYSIDGKDQSVGYEKDPTQESVFKLHVEKLNPGMYVLVGFIDGCTFIAKLLKLE